MPEVLSHKAVGMSEKGATTGSLRCREGGETSEAYLSKERTVVCHTAAITNGGESVRPLHRAT